MERIEIAAPIAGEPLHAGVSLGRQSARAGLGLQAGPAAVAHLGGTGAASSAPAGERDFADRPW
jgi:hypothetical protein